MDIKDYKIGDSLYRYVEFGGVFEYKVLGIVQLENSTQLQVQAQNCNHGWKCELQLAQDDYKRIISIHMLNDDEDCTQKHWNKQSQGLYFRSTPELAKLDALKLNRKRVFDDLNKCKDSIKALEKRLNGIDLAISIVEK